MDGHVVEEYSNQAIWELMYFGHARGEAASAATADVRAAPEGVARRYAGAVYMEHRGDRLYGGLAGCCPVRSVRIRKQRHHQPAGHLLI